MRLPRRGGLHHRRVRTTERQARSRSSIVRRRRQPVTTLRGPRRREEEESPAAAAPPTQLDGSDSSGAESAARLRPEDRRLLQRVRRVLAILGEPSRTTVRTAIHAFLDWAFAYRRAHVSRPEGDDSSDSRS